MATVTLLLPTYNEIDGFRAIFPQIDLSLFDDVLVVDGGSKDGTVEYALENGIRIMTQIRKGLGPGVYDAVSILETDCVIEFSLDGNCLPEHLQALVGKLREGYDLVVVSRYKPPAVSYDDTLVTRFGNWMFSKMIRYLGPFAVTDSLNIYRGFHLKIFRLPEFNAFLYGPVFEPLTSALANVKRMKIYELSGDEPKRIGGASKMSPLYNGSCILLMIIRCYLLKFGLLSVKGS
jgi:glycosyltransferase involved in cell wall biosynthesis